VVQNLSSDEEVPPLHNKTGFCKFLFGGRRHLNASRVLPHEKIPANRVASLDGEHIAMPSGTPRSNFSPHFPNPFFIASATP
jgi:hypothetical protein